MFAGDHYGFGNTPPLPEVQSRIILNKHEFSKVIGRGGQMIINIRKSCGAGEREFVGCRSTIWIVNIWWTCFCVNSGSRQGHWCWRRAANDLDIRSISSSNRRIRHDIRGKYPPSNEDPFSILIRIFYSCYIIALPVLPQFLRRCSTLRLQWSTPRRV